MAYRTEWVDPEVFLRHNGKVIYHTYKDSDWGNGVMTYWFTSDQDDTEETYYFDVRSLPTSDPDKVGSGDEEAMAVTIRAAIDAGLIVFPEEV